MKYTGFSLKVSNSTPVYTMCGHGARCNSSNKDIGKVPF